MNKQGCIDYLEKRLECGGYFYPADEKNLREVIEQLRWAAGEKPEEPKPVTINNYYYNTYPYYGLYPPGTIIPYN